MALITSLLTIVMSGVVSVVVSYKLTTNRDMASFLRQKAEELFIASEQYSRDMFGYMTYLLPLFKGEITYGEYYEKQAEISNDGSRGHQKMMMLLSIYFPNLMPFFEEIDKWRSECVKIQTMHKKANVLGLADDPKTYLDPFNNAMVKFDIACKAFQQAIVARAREIEVEPIISRDSWLSKTMTKLRRYISTRLSFFR